MNTSQSISAHPVRRPEDNPAGDDYPAFIGGLRAAFSLAEGSFFHTDAGDIWETFLAHLSPEMRQHHNCNACRRFVERYGGLVAVTSRGKTLSALWGFNAPPAYASAVQALREQVERAQIVGVCLSSEKHLGTPITGVWTHMSVPNPAPFQHLTLTAGQVAADKREDRQLLERGLDAYPLETVRLAHALLTDGRLYRSEKCVGVAKWLLDLHVRLAGVKHARRRDALLWSAVATAPVGFCHVGSTMIGTLLDDIKAGLDLAVVKRRFDAKMSPLQYQRPTAPPTAGNIAEAERIVGALKAAGSLERRYARLEEVVPHALWTPRPRREKPGRETGVFGHIVPKVKRPQINGTIIPGLAPVTLTWEKFAREVLPRTETLEYLVTSHGSYIALVTAVHAEAPPILQWDREDQRNPVSWYVYSGGSPSILWRLRPGEYVSVSAVTLLPSMWHGRHEHQGAGVVLLLEGCVDSGVPGLGLFPEILRSELRPVRATIEAYSRRGTLQGAEEAGACGLDLRKGGRWGVILRACVDGVSRTYQLDRWD